MLNGSTIGNGGFAVVKNATVDGLPCAVKLLKPELQSEEYLTRFRREVRQLLHIQGGSPIKAAAALEFITRHHVVPLIARNVRADNASPWFAMPKANHNATRYLAENSGPGSMWLFREVCAGIAKAHSKGVIHRDIKPSNVLIFTTAEGTLVSAVSDFGIGRFVFRDTPTVTQTQELIGTPEFWSPEQASGDEHVDQRSDIYSLGKLLYKAMTGLSPIRIDLGKLPQNIAPIVERATQVAREERYQTVEDLLSALP